MAQGTKGTVGRPASNAATAPSSNGVLTSNNTGGVAGGNRKKQKRRQKQAAKAAAEQEQTLRQTASGNSHASNGRVSPTRSLQSSHDDPHSLLERYNDDTYFTDDDTRAYHPYHPTLPNGHISSHEVATNGSRKNKKKKKKDRSVAHDSYLQQQSSSNTYPPSAAHNHPPHTSSTSKSPIQSVKHTNDRDRIWNTSTQEERERIKEFWLSLGEDERKSLVKIEKEAVLRKMKEQQKHSCSCTVCGRKRTAIEEELEVLYDAYYDELEQYGSLQHGPMLAGPKRLTRHADILSSEHVPPLMHTTQPSHGHIEELPDEDEEDEEEDEDELYSDEEAYDDEYSDDEPEGLSGAAANDFFNFGNSLTVKGGILTVADDLLKNDGKKFIEMMEQLAERRMAREEEAQYAAASHPSGSYHGSYGHNHPPDDEEYEEEDEDDYDSQEDYDDEDDEMDVMTEEQRMEEGRRMFQIFAARMFEQRVLTAYREKVAHERQQKLLEELEEEKSHDVQREAKKARDAQKKKEKKALQKQKQAEEKARREAERAAEEAAAKAAEEKKQEELRKKREEQRKKKEADRKAQEEEKQRKEAEKLKRQQEDRERHQEAERRAREQKAAEKRARDEDARKKREQREAKDRDAKERKAQVDREKREREEKVKADREAQDRARKEAAQAAHAAHQAAQVPKRTGAPTAVPIPPGLHKLPSNVSSPHIPVTTPALPKAPTPVRVRQGSQHGSKGSSPKTPSIAASQSKSVSPATTSSSQQPQIAPKTILQKPPAQALSAAPQQPQPASPMHTMPPPPGMSMPQTTGFAGPPGLNGFPVSQSPMVPGMVQRGPSIHNSQIFQPQGPPPGSQFRPFAPPGALPPTGVNVPVIPFGRGFPEPPPGLPQQFPGMGAGTQGGQFTQLGREPISASSGPGTHSRQTSFDQKSFEPTTSGPPAQPIARPAPIKRPLSVKPDAQEDNGPDVDDITRHLGSSALLEDVDDPIPLVTTDMPRPGAPNLMRGSSNVSAFGASPIFTNSLGQQRMESFGPSNSSNPSSTWSTPPMPFGQTGLPGAPSWGSSSSGSGWPSVTPSLPGFGIGIGTSGGQHTQHRRPVQIRLNICNACRQLAATKAGNADGFVDAGAVLRQMENNGIQPTVSAEEMLDICETEGNSTNGGGVFQVKRTDNPLLSQIKYESDQTSGPRSSGPGDIGSPTFASASLSGGPFGSMRGFPGFGTLNG